MIDEDDLPPVFRMNDAVTNSYEVATAALV